MCVFFPLAAHIPSWRIKRTLQMQRYSNKPAPCRGRSWEQRRGKAQCIGKKRLTGICSFHLSKETKEFRKHGDSPWCPHGNPHSPISHRTRLVVDALCEWEFLTTACASCRTLPGRCYRAWLSSDLRLELASPIMARSCFGKCASVALRNFLPSPADGDRCFARTTCPLTLRYIVYLDLLRLVAPTRAKPRSWGQVLRAKHLSPRHRYPGGLDVLSPADGERWFA